MIPFITGTDVRNRLAINPNLSGLDDTINSGISAAYLFVRSQLDSDFDQTAHTDLFYLDETMNGGITPNGFWRLRLRSGLIDTTQPFVVTVGEGWDMENPSPVAPTMLKLDPLKGVLSIPHFVQVPGCYSRLGGLFSNGGGGLSGGQYVQVTYTSGFTSNVDDTDPDNPITTISPPPPDWLVESLLSYVPSIFMAQQPTNKPEKGDSDGNPPDIVRHVMSVLEPYSRTGLSFYLNPVF